MDALAIEATIRKVNQKFVEEMTPEEKRIASEEFKKLYAEEMGKATLQISKRKKINQNLANIKEAVTQQVKDIDHELKIKMENHHKKREQLQSTKVKSMKIMEENWKRKLDQIHKKKKDQDKESYKKAEKMRKEVEEFWIRKSQSAKDNREEDQIQLIKSPINSSLENQKSYFKSHEKQFQGNYFSKDKKGKTLLPTLGHTKFNSLDKSGLSSMNLSPSKISKNQKIKLHLEKSLHLDLEKEEFVFQRAMEKLKKIEDTRYNVQQRLHKQIHQAKRIRELKENPQALAQRRQKSIESLKSKSKEKIYSKHRINGLLSVKNDPSKQNLSESIVKHLQTKKKIQETQFQERGHLLESAMKKLRRKKLNRLVKEAVNLVKLETYKHMDE